MLNDATLRQIMFITYPACCKIIGQKASIIIGGISVLTLWDKVERIILGNLKRSGINSSLSLRELTKVSNPVARSDGYKPLSSGVPKRGGAVRQARSGVRLG